MGKQGTTELPGMQDQASSQPQLPSVRGRFASPWLALTGGLAGGGALLALFLSGRFTDAMPGLELLLAVGMLLAVVWAGVSRRRMLGEMALLEALLSEVRQGLEPIESLSRIGGRLAPLAAICHDLARDLRQERARTTQLQDEVHQRIANRTVALERTIGALRQQAARDALTGLFNRRMLDAYLPEAIDRCKSSGMALCLLMIDVDHFKPLNDTLGHAAGDQMLRSIAQIIRSTVRDTDLAFRCGGDEFVVVIEGCNTESARAVIERLNSLGDALGRTFRITPPPRLSIGLCTLADVSEPTAKALLSKADQALYQVKADHHNAAGTSRPRQSA